MKKIFKYSLVLLIIGYLFLYVAYRNGYYIKKNTDTMILTEEKIKEYEDDLKNGVDVTNKSYIVTQENYDNSYTRFLLKLSNKIEKGFDTVIKFIFQRISKQINE